MKLTEQDLQALECFNNKPEEVLEEEILAHWSRMGELTERLGEDPKNPNLASEISCVGYAMTTASKQLRELRAAKAAALH